MNDDDIKDDNIPEEADLVLTTSDNPYHPKTDYLKWKQWDEESGYNTESYLARLLLMDKDFNVDDELGTIELARKAKYYILENDSLNVYMLVH